MGEDAGVVVENEEEMQTIEQTGMCHVVGSELRGTGTLGWKRGAKWEVD